jgi:photosystem II stability/assembly factor-like uncharacterized protein
MVFNMFFINNQTGFTLIRDDCCTDLYRTTDSGLNWHICLSPDSGRINAVSFAGELKGLAIVRIGFPGIQPKIFKTTDGGDNWFFLCYHPQSGKIFYYNYQLAWIAGSNGYIAKTTNGGNSWFNQSTCVTNSLNDVYFFTKMKGIAVGGNGVVLRTTDGGQNWNAKYHVTTSLESIDRLIQIMVGLLEVRVSF